MPRHLAGVSGFGSFALRDRLASVRYLLAVLWSAPPNA